MRNREKQSGSHLSSAIRATRSPGFPGTRPLSSGSAPHIGVRACACVRVCVTHVLVQPHAQGVRVSRCGLRVCEGEQSEQGKHMSWPGEQAAPRILSNASLQSKHLRLTI